uniref:LAGLIDADG_2 domain-containing protein n=1 Tax=Strongyloides stercoralis TaxID=6248 RepID=A0A0K0E7F2_STRER
MSEEREHRRKLMSACVLWLGTQIDSIPKFDEYSVDKYQQKKENKVYMKNKCLPLNWLYAIDGSIYYINTGVSSIAGISFNYPIQFCKFLKIHGQKLDDYDDYYLILSALKLSNIVNYEKMTGFERFEKQKPDVRYVQYLIASISLNKSSGNANNANDLLTENGGSITGGYTSSCSSDSSTVRKVKKKKEGKKNSKKTPEIILKNEYIRKQQIEGYYCNDTDLQNNKDVESSAKNDSDKKNQNNFEKWLMEANLKGPGVIPLPKAGYDNLESLVAEAEIKKRPNKCSGENENNLINNKCDNFKRTSQGICQDRSSAILRRQFKPKKKSDERKKHEE